MLVTPAIHAGSDVDNRHSPLGSEATLSVISECAAMGGGKMLTVSSVDCRRNQYCHYCGEQGFHLIVIGFYK